LPEVFYCQTGGLFLDGFIIIFEASPLDAKWNSSQFYLVKAVFHLRLLLGLLPLSFLAILVSCGGFRLEVKIPKSIIIKQVERKFPTVKSKGLITVKLSHPVLDFKGSSNRLGVRADAEVRVLNVLPIRGLIDCDGSLLYKPETGTFHFTDVKVKKFSFKELPSSRADEINGLLATSVL
jgi:hypothetical protein